MYVHFSKRETRLLRSVSARTWTAAKESEPRRRRVEELVPGWCCEECAAFGVLPFCTEEFVQGFDCDLEFGAAWFGGRKVTLEEVADGYGRAGLAEDEPGL